MLTADTDRYSSCAGRNNDERVDSKIDQTAQKATGTKVFEVDQSCKMSDNAGIQSSEMSLDYTSEHSDTEITTPLDQRMVNNATCGLEKRPQKNNASVQTQISKMESDVDKQSENIPPANDGKTSKTLDQTEERNGLSITTESVSVCIEMNELIEAINGESCHTKSPSEVITNLSSGSDGESMDLESDLCRICHCSEEAEVLISPCLCTGSVKFVHHSCLMSWLQRAVMSKCELCLYPLAVKRKRKSISKWRLPEDKPFPILWLFTFVVAMTLNVASIAKDGSQQCVSNPCIIFYVLGSAGALLGLAFFYHWLRKTIRYLAKWVALNEEWTLVGPVDLRSQIGETNLAFSTKSLSDVATAQVEVT